MRKEAVIRGIIVWIVGGIIAGFGYADIAYYLTDLPVEVDEAFYYIVSIIAFVGFIYLVYGLIAKPSIPPQAAYYQPPGSTYAPTPAPTYAPTQAPQPQAQPQQPRCPTCGQPLELIQQYNRWYCRTCQKYV
jgi:hypothetical protein